MTRPEPWERHRPDLLAWGLTNLGRAALGALKLWLPRRRHQLPAALACEQLDDLTPDVTAVLEGDA